MSAGRKPTDGPTAAVERRNILVISLGMIGEKPATPTK
jgi:hypothetical protein